MSMTVRKKRDVRTPHVFVHKLADLRGGVSVATSELGGNYLREGAVLSAPDTNGVCHVVKTAEVASAVGGSDVKIKVKKFHNFKVGDFVMAEVGKAADAITAIDTKNKDYDEITVATALGAITVGKSIVEATAKNATGALKYEPQSINGTGQEFAANSNISTDAWVMGVTKNNPIPSAIVDKLKGIINL